MTDLKAKSQTLEAQLMSMCASSSQVTQNFIAVKNELENENAILTEQAAELRAQLDKNEKCIDVLEKENYEVQCQVDSLTERVVGLTKVMGLMRRQREMLVQAADRWEDSLRECANVEGVTSS